MLKKHNALGIFALTLFAAAPPTSALAQTSPFEGGWHLLEDRSTLSFTSVKDGDIEETNSFRKLSGGIDEEGNATLVIALDTIDTAIDIRDQRLRYILLKTPRYPTATAALMVQDFFVEGLEEERQIVFRAPYTLNLAGIDHTSEVQISLTLNDDDTVSVTTVEPVRLDLADLGLLDGITRLEALAGVDITPSTDVTFGLTFDRGPVPEPVEVAALPQTTDAAEPMTLDACTAALTDLSSPGNISFLPGSSTLQEDSLPKLDTVAGVISRCPETRIEIGGHTDSDGSRNGNLGLSERRGTAVADYLAEKGVDRARLEVVGYGESSPAVANDSPANKALNRRIEFKPIDG